MKKILVVGFVTCMLFWVGTAWAVPVDQGTGDPVGSVIVGVTPSTNEYNYNNGLPYVLFDSAGTDSISLNFVNTLSGNWIFNYRIDSLDGPEGSVTPGAFSTSQQTFTPVISFVDVQLTRGPETDYKFDWTRFYVASVPAPEPGTLLLLGSGLAGLGVVTWRRRKSG